MTMLVTAEGENILNSGLDIPILISRLSIMNRIFVSNNYANRDCIGRTEIISYKCSSPGRNLSTG